MFRILQIFLHCSHLGSSSSLHSAWMKTHDPQLAEKLSYMVYFMLGPMALSQRIFSNLESTGFILEVHEMLILGLFLPRLSSLCHIPSDGSIIPYPPDLFFFFSYPIFEVGMIQVRLRNYLMDFYKYLMKK